MVPLALERTTRKRIYSITYKKVTLSTCQGRFAPRLSLLESFKNKIQGSSITNISVVGSVDIPRRMSCWLCGFETTELATNAKATMVLAKSVKPWQKSTRRSARQWSPFGA